MPAKIYTDKDADHKALKGKTCAVIGFGSQGHAHALNLKESGVKVIIGLYPKSKSRKVAADYGFEVLDTGEAVKKADVIFVAVPDTKIPSDEGGVTPPPVTRSDRTTVIGTSIPTELTVTIQKEGSTGFVASSGAVDQPPLPALPNNVTPLSWRECSTTTPCP